ncbi:hypothetical protein TJA_17100 [Thermus sp. LT1-2-5]
MGALPAFFGSRTWDEADPRSDYPLACSPIPLWPGCGKPPCSRPGGTLLGLGALERRQRFALLEEPKRIA